MAGAEVHRRVDDYGNAVEVASPLPLPSLAALTETCPRSGPLTAPGRRLPVEAFLPQGSLVCDVVGKRTNAARHLFFGMVLLPIWGEHVMVRSVPTLVGARHRDL